MPCSPNHPGFRMTLIRRHGDMVRPDGGSAANEIIVTGGHVGTHVDALSHVSHDGLMYGGVDAAQSQVGGSFRELGAEHTPAFLCRGVLLDVAATLGVPSSRPVRASARRSCRPRSTGAAPTCGRVTSPSSGPGGRRTSTTPNATSSKAERRAGRRPTEAAGWPTPESAWPGSDTTAFEQILPGAGHSVLPVHRVLLVENGIHIIEHLALEEASAAGLTAFIFVMAPLRIVGGTGSPVRPFAAVSA